MSIFYLYILFVKYGLLSFGGGYVLITLFVHDLVEKYQLLTGSEFGNLLAIAQMTPGPIGINTATYVGFTQQGIAGAVAATAGMITPALLLVILAVKLLKKYEKSLWIQGFLAGMRPASFGLILSAAVVFAELSIFTGSLPWLEWLRGEAAGISIHPGALLLAIGTFIVMRRTKIPFLWLLAASALLGGFLC